MPPRSGRVRFDVFSCILTVEGPLDNWGQRIPEYQQERMGACVTDPAESLGASPRDPFRGEGVVRDRYAAVDPQAQPGALECKLGLSHSYEASTSPIGLLRLTRPAEGRAFHRLARNKRGRFDRYPVCMWRRSADSG